MGKLSDRKPLTLTLAEVPHCLAHLLSLPALWVSMPCLVAFLSAL